MNDKTNAAAIVAARQHLEKLGVKYTAIDMGECAGVIVIGLNRELAREEDRKVEALKKKMARE